ncbi:MAG: putative Zn finger protein [Halobacteriales archaeon]|jgi:uncharacterized Zn finger protein
MDLTESDVRDRCTTAVYERGQTYLAEGRIKRRARFGETVTAVVSGSRDYDLTLDHSTADIGCQCSCPYDGPGICKHAVAVLLSLVDDPPQNEGPHVETTLDRVEADELREFLRDELATDPPLRDRFLARFGESTARSVGDLRTEIDGRFEETNPQYAVVFEPIDFSDLFGLASTFRSRDAYESAATVYRALTEGLDDNMELVDGSYDHFAGAFQRALNGYVECVATAEIDAGERSDHAQFLEERATSGTDFLQERFEGAATELRERAETD